MDTTHTTKPVNSKFLALLKIALSADAKTILLVVVVTAKAMDGFVCLDLIVACPSTDIIQVSASSFCSFFSAIDLKHFYTAEAVAFS